MMAHTHIEEIDSNQYLTTPVTCNVTSYIISVTNGSISVSSLFNKQKVPKLQQENNNNVRLYAFFWVIPQRLNFVPKFRNALSVPSS